MLSAVLLPPAIIRLLSYLMRSACLASCLALAEQDINLTKFFDYLLFRVVFLLKVSPFHTQLWVIGTNITTGPSYPA